MSYMWTPTLCATATAVGVSAVGYALGRPEQRQLDPSTQKRKQSSEPFDAAAVATMPSRLASPTPATPVGISSLSPATNPPSSASGARLSYDGRTHSGKIRRLTTSDAAAQRRTDHERSSTPGSDGVAPDFGPRLTLRTRPSWMKRLSAMSTSRNSESSASSSPRPESPTVSQSNGSAGFSNAGSTVPIVGSSPTAPLPPNKLVKRSSSQRLVGGSSDSRIPTLRRPATSHQRSATLKILSRSTGSTSDRVSVTTGERSRRGAQSETRWKQFFSVKTSKGSALARNASSSTDVKGIKRVLPDQRYYPTLITAKSVVTSMLDVDDFPEYDDDSVFFGSRPHSAFGLESMSLTPGRISIPADEASAQPTASENTPVEAHPRRSFSLHDLLSIAPIRKPSTNKAPSNRLTKKSGRRVVSEPLHAAGHRQNIAPSDWPSKRRDITDPSIFHGELSNTLDASQQFADAPRGTDHTSPSSPFTFTSHTHSTTSHNDEYSPSISQQPSFLGPLKLDQISHSPILSQAPIRPSNHSAAPSEQTSTLIGSETDARLMGSAEESDGELGSETMFDSLRTRGTRSTSGARGTRIETIFDESPPPRTVHSSLKDMLPVGMLSSRDGIVRKSSDIIEEEESIGTPVRTVRSDRADDGSPTAHRIKVRSPLPAHMLIPSSPPDMAKPLSLGTLEYDDPVMEEDEESRWSCFDDEESASNSEHGGWEGTEQVATPLTMRRSNPFLVPAGSSSGSATPQHLQLDPSDKDARKDTRSTLFDWSEQPAEKSPGNRSPQRPRTVHGKKDMDGRGSRPNKRRAPSGLHVRSQSVPVVPDLAGKRETLITNKFGTWGVGSKGVSEDWDDDFDFGDGVPTNTAQSTERDEKRIDSGIVMRIPQVIRDQQANVMNNIGLVREFGLLIEELKALRVRATSLGILDGPIDDLWEQIDSMIDLADQEADDPAIPHRLSPPSSPGFDMIAFEEAAEAPSRERSRRKSGRSTSATHNATTITPTNSRKVRKSVLPLDNDVFSGPSGSAKSTEKTTPGSTATTTANRPRKDSEAMARSVIEALKKRKSASDPTLSLQPVPSSKKVPFDTTTLRHIVPYVNSLVRKVKEQLREAEGFDISREPSPDWDEPQDPPDPPFSQMFKDPSPGPDSPSRKPRGPRSNKSKSNDGFQNLDDINKQMKLMTVM